MAFLSVRLLLNFLVAVKEGSALNENLMRITPRARTRRLIAKVLLAILVCLVAWLLLPGDLGVNEKEVAISLVGFISLFLLGFAGFETANDHSERKHDFSTKPD